MRRIASILIASMVLISFQGCMDDLDILPTTATTATQLATPENVDIALIGMYKLLQDPNSSYHTAAGNNQQYAGVPGMYYRLDCYCEDVAVLDMGSGWFYFDYLHDINRKWDNAAWSCYGMWNYLYKLSVNANAFIDAAMKMGEGKKAKIVQGQVLAFHGFAYYYLSQFFCLPYQGNEDKPGVPITRTLATEPSGRGTVQEVYDVVIDDFKQAYEKFNDENVQYDGDAGQEFRFSRKVVAGMLARVYLSMNDYEKAEEWATKALGHHHAPKVMNLSIVEKTDCDFGKGTESRFVESSFSDLDKAESLMWGQRIMDSDDNGGNWGTFYCHMDGNYDTYGQRSPKMISKALYDNMRPYDLRKQWWISDDLSDYRQVKFTWKDFSENVGDQVYMRAEEMMLIQAECMVRRGDYAGAKKLLEELMSKRVKPGHIEDYTNYLNSLEESAVLNVNATYEKPVTLLEEVFFQRRVELWAEGARWTDVRRLGIGIKKNRSYAGNNHSFGGKLEDEMNVLKIPLREFNGNPNLDQVKDQN